MKLQIFNLIKKQPAPEGQKDTSKGILSWGINNSKPKQIIDTINGSITGGACINTLRRYVYGSGLTVESDFEVSKDLTALAFHRQLSSQIVKLRGVAVLVKYTVEGKASITKIPFESCRLGIPDEQGDIFKIHYNPYFGLPDYRDEHTVIYDTYNPDPAVIKEQITEAKGFKKYKGQVMWKAVNSEFNEFYPLPEWFGNNKGKGGGKKWMEIEQLVGDFHEHNIEKGFLENVLMKLIGDPDDAIPEHVEKKAKNEKYTTVGDAFEEMMNNKFSGATGDKMLVLWSKVTGEFPELEAFPAETHHDLFLALQKLSTENILIATQVPPVLAGVKVSGTLSKDDIVNAVKLMWGNVEDEQQFLEEIYNELFPRLIKPWNEKVFITNYSPIAMGVDPLIWDVMTDKEKREWVTENTDIELDGLQEPADN